MVHIPAYRYYATLLGLVGAAFVTGAWYSHTVRVFSLDEFAGTEHNVVVEAAGAWAVTEYIGLAIGAIALLAALMLGTIGAARARSRTGHEHMDA